MELQPDDWKPFVVTEESITELWKKLQGFPIVFDDYGKNDFQGFVAKFFSRNNMFFDIGDGTGLACAMGVRPRLDMVVHLIMFDRRLRGREPVFLNLLGYLFRSLQLRRATAIIPSDAQTGINLAKRLGFLQEGIMRDATIRDGKYIDLEVFGLLREDLNATLEAQSARSTSDNAA